MQCIYFLISVFALYLAIRYFYHQSSIEYVLNVMDKFNDIKSSLSEDEEEWLKSHMEYLVYISGNKYMCNKKKIKERFTKDLEVATYCGLFSSDNYSLVYEAINQ